MPYKLIQMTSFHTSRWSSKGTDICKQCGKKLKEPELVAIKESGTAGRARNHYCEKCAKILHLV